MCLQTIHRSWAHRTTTYRPTNQDPYHGLDLSHLCFVSDLQHSVTAVRQIIAGQNRHNSQVNVP
jgi:hypothetical protein